MTNLSSNKTLLIVIIAMLAGAAFLGIRNMLRNEIDATANTIAAERYNTNGALNTVTVTNQSITPTKNTANAANAAVINTNTVSANTVGTNANTNTSTAQTVTVADAIANAPQYDDSSLCVRGYYQTSFEFSGMAVSFSTSEGRKNLLSPYIWVETDVPESSLDCSTSSVGQKSCFGEITTCGIFHAAAPDEPGFGHTNAYRYELVRPETPNTNSSLKSINTP